MNKDKRVFQNNHCRACVQYPICRDSRLSWFLLFVGIIATITVRLVNIVLPVSVLAAKIFWYIGIAGFMIYFLIKFVQDKKLRDRIKGNDLELRLKNGQALTPDDYEFLRGVICRLKSQKEIINSFLIFFTSALALAWAIVQDFFVK
jgi:hypothetical protein